MSQLKLSVSPHIHSGRSTSRIMLDVIIALLPATAAGAVIFGMRSLMVVGVCMAACVIFEAIFNFIIKKPLPVGDFSAAVTGLLLGLNLPANIPIWQCIVGSFFAIVVVKGLFGGLGANPVNPAITARVFMLVAFGSMAKAAFPVVVDTASSATPLAAEKATSILDLLVGVHGGAIGETCAVALLIGGVYLLIRRVITWHIPVAFVGTVYIASFFMEGMDPMAALAAILSGGLLLGAFFMATDYVTSPATPCGKIIFGLGAGLITFLIRYFGVYPEGVSFAILFMNIITPYISSWTKRKVFGLGGSKA
ncbi:MAG: RnfABCDGE type electron transport complex subunit D [Ruminococcaceae bacterium]|nr:RnfABCDGE type electron transport complex subunit D [Oscillospiraceae bacterium]